MKVFLFPTTNIILTEDDSMYAMEAVKLGLSSLGIQVVDNIGFADIGIAWGWKHPDVLKCKKDVLVLERGYIGDRHQWTSVGFNGINRMGDFIKRDMPGDRWNRHFGEMAEWGNKEDGYFLITGQNLKDANTSGIRLKEEYTKLYNICSKQRPTLFRPHPGRMGVGAIPDNATVTQGDYMEELKGAYCVVSFSSNSMVDAILAGIPVVSLDKRSMVYDITGHTIDDIRRPERLQWAYNIMYRQWLLEEIVDGSMLRFVLGEKYGN
jgi:hypothetical protein